MARDLTSAPLGAIAAWFARPPRRPRAIAWDELRAGDFAPAERERLASAWAARAREERAAMGAFAELAAELDETRASSELVGALGRVVADEARHAKLCQGVAGALGASTGGEIRRVRSDKRYPPRERTTLVLVGSLCIAESWSAAVFAAELERVTHPVLRDVEREILAEEVSHGRLGFAWLVDCWMALPLSTRMLVERSLPSLFAALERKQPRQRRTLFMTTMSERIIPALQRAGVRAQQAWERRLQ